jgi:hypothetical protein
MDQGIAAVLGAAVGVVGALGAAALAYLGVRQQSRATGQIEYAKAVWAERTELYAAFIDAVEEADHALINGRAILSALRSALSGLERNATSQEAANKAEEALAKLREAKDLIRAAYKCASRIRVLGPQTLLDATTDVVQALNGRLGTLSRSLGAAEQGAEVVGQLLDEEREQASSFTQAFGGFTARAAHVIEGHELPRAGDIDATREP